MNDLHILLEMIDNRHIYLIKYSSITNIINNTLKYINTLKIIENGKLTGYKFSKYTSKNILYSTISVLLLKHLYGIFDESIEEEINILLDHQSEDGLFIDPNIDCNTAYNCDWWGWNHLTLHALMTLALYNVKIKKKIKIVDNFKNSRYLYNYLNSLHWDKEVANTSNAIQNLGVILQYLRDFCGEDWADKVLDNIYTFLDEKQNKRTGLYYPEIKNKFILSQDVQSGYHFWLLYFYDGRKIKYEEKIIDNVLKTQNIAGGFGVRLNSSACEDIDSIDPLVRFNKLTKYRKNDIKKALGKAFKWILFNLNPDGGFVFFRNKPLYFNHPEMFAPKNCSNLMHTWFRMLGLAYCLIGIENIPNNFKYNWNFKKAPGHQFL